MSRSNVVFLMLGSVLMAIAAAYYSWPQLTASLLVRYQYRDMPKVWRKPVPLPDVSISPTPHRKITWMGYQVELPWDDMDAEKDFPAAKMHGVHFRSGNSVVFNGDDYLREMFNQLQSRAKNSGGPPLKVPDVYPLHIESVGITLDQVSPFIRREAVGRDIFLLVQKQLLPDSDSGLFEYWTPLFHGFQFESKHTRPYIVVEQLYAPDATIEIQFAQQGPSSARILTQPEINRVLQSIHKLPSPPAPGPHRLP